MREAKFRAWDKNAYRMAEVTQIIFSKVQHTLVKYRYKTDNGKVKDETSHIDEKGHGTIVLMQYTGERDVNGKEIYEGDIVKVDTKIPHKKYPKVFKVEFRDAGFIANNIIEGWYDDLINITFPNSNAVVTVIGNIYEDPELLEV